MKRDILRYSWLLLLLLLCGGAALADDFNPANPPDPQRPPEPVTPPTLYQVTVSTNAGQYASGGGQYEEGANVLINTSASATGFEFKYWTKNGEQYSTNQSFYYTMETADVSFVAVYVFNPDNPADPSKPDTEATDPEIDNPERYTLTFIVDGVVLQQEELREGTPIEAPEAPAKQGYKFDGWTPDVPATMPAEDVTLTAVYSSLYATITIGAAGQATYSDSRDLDFTNVSGLRAYIASGYSSSAGEATMTRVFKVPAGEGLYLRGEPGSYEVPYGKSDYIYANLLVGVPTATIVNPTEGEYTNFILTYDEVDGIGFYPMDSTDEIGPNKAYLQLTTSAFAACSRIYLVFDDEEEEATGIKDLNEKGAMSARPKDACYQGDARNEKFFDLQGRRVANPTRGLYIKDGKKIMVK